MSAPAVTRPTNNAKQPAPDTRLVRLSQATEHIEQILDEHLKQIAQPTVKRMAKAIMTAQARQNIRHLLTPEIMGLFMELQNQQDGFLTDRIDPKNLYGIDTVRNCVMEGFFQGVYPFNNELNIIAGRLMLVKNGWAGKIEREFACQAFYDNEVPDKGPGATWKVHVYCWCKRDGKQIEITGRDNTKGRTYLVTAYKDAIDSLLGKAQRRALRDLWRLLAGMSYDEEESRPEEEPKPEVKVEPVLPAPVHSEPTDIPSFAQTKGWTRKDAIQWAFAQGCFARETDAESLYAACRKEFTDANPKGTPTQMAVAFARAVQKRTEETLEAIPAAKDESEFENA